MCVTNGAHNEHLWTYNVNWSFVSVIVIGFSRLDNSIGLMEQFFQVNMSILYAMYLFICQLNEYIKHNYLNQHFYQRITAQFINLIPLYNLWGRRLIGISGSLIWSKTLMELMFNPCGEFRWSSEGPASQIHSPHLLVGALGVISDLLRSVQMLKREWDAESNGSYRTY